MIVQAFMLVRCAGKRAEYVFVMTTFFCASGEGSDMIDNVFEISAGRSQPCKGCIWLGAQVTYIFVRGMGMLKHIVVLPLFVGEYAELIAGNGIFGVKSEHAGKAR